MHERAAFSHKMRELEALRQPSSARDDRDPSPMGWGREVSLMGWGMEASSMGWGREVSPMDRDRAVSPTGRGREVSPMGRERMVSPIAKAAEEPNAAIAHGSEPAEQGKEEEPLELASAQGLVRKFVRIGRVGEEGGKRGEASGIESKQGERGEMEGWREGGRLRAGGEKQRFDHPPPPPLSSQAESSAAARDAGTQGSRDENRCARATGGPRPPNHRAR